MGYKCPQFYKIMVTIVIVISVVIGGLSGEGELRWLAYVTVRLHVSN